MAIVEEKLAPVHVRGKISELILFISTSKGAFLYYSDPDRRHWDVNGPHFLGSKVYHLILDYRDNKTLIASTQSFNNDSIIYISKNLGRSWEPANSIPDLTNNDYICHLSPGHISDPKTWYAGTSNQGLLKSIDGGLNWETMHDANSNSEINKVINANKDDYQKNSKLQSIITDPQNKKHLYVGLSPGGVFESLDNGKNWQTLKKGLLTNNKANSINNPYSIASHSLEQTYLFQQNSLGIFRLNKSSSEWVHIGNNLPKDIGDLGLPITIHPADPNTIWVFPMDNNETFSRVSPGGQPAIYCSQDAGDSWFRQDIGLPMRNAWFTVTEKCLSTDYMDNTGVYFGTTSGSLWMSDNEGNSWRQIAVHLPEITAIETGVILKK